MGTTRADVEAALVRGGGVLLLRDQPSHRRTVERLVQDRVLRMLLPGVAVRWQDAADVDVRIRAAATWAPAGVLTGAAAARATFWPELIVPVIRLSSKTHRESRPGFRICRETIPPGLIRMSRGLRMTVPALTALDLAAERGGEGIDRALLRRSATLAQMHDALSLTSGRRGNVLRRAMLHDSRDEPWSEAERTCHALLRVAGIRGWRTNVAVSCGDERYFLDVAFERLKVAVEVDGYAYHRAENRRQFHHDREKWSRLTAAGWLVLHVTWEQLTTDHARFLTLLRTTLARAERLSA